MTLISMDNANERYHSLSILLHWIIMLGLLFMFASGVYMVNVDISKADQYKLYQIHKASGVIMLWAIAFRIGVRLLIQSPLYIHQLTKKQNQHAKIGHIALYIALIVMPLSGWLMVSASPFGLPTLVFFDWINWPHIPGVAGNKAIQSAANLVHWITAILLFIMIAGHICAVVWHHKKHNINLMKRMWWAK